MQGYEDVGKILRITERFKNGNVRALIEQACPQCGGRGNLPHVKHVEGGRCFRCNGIGTHTISRVVMTQENRAKADRLNGQKQQSKKQENANIQERLQQEQEQQEKLQECQLAKNKTFTRNYRAILELIDKRNAYEVTFARNLLETMRYRPLNHLSMQEKASICDFLARKMHRRHSKKYEDLYAKLMADLSEDYSI